MMDWDKGVRRLQILIGLIIGVVVIALVATAGALVYSTYKSWEIDYRNHQAMVQIIQYNLQQGKLVALPAAPPAVAAPVAPPAAPTEKK